MLLPTLADHIGIDWTLLLLLQQMIKQNTLPFIFDTSLPTRFGVLPRYAKDESDMKWFEVPALMMFHVANAWQEGDVIKLHTCCFDQVSGASN